MCATGLVGVWWREFTGCAVTACGNVTMGVSGVRKNPLNALGLQAVNNCYKDMRIIGIDRRTGDFGVRCD